VTIRDRDTMTQERVAIDQLVAVVAGKVSMSQLFKAS
jgi:glycyl-tRNA synthetase (class II)